jgi:hypothetical protein
MFLNVFILPLRSWVLTALTFTLKSFSTAALISGLEASRATRNTTWLCSETSVDFSVMAGARMTSWASLFFI